MAAATVVSLQRLQLFKTLQDELNARTFLGIHATADDAQKLHTAVNIDGISFDGSADITLPTKVVQVYSDGEGKYYSDSAKTQEVTEFDINKLYVDLTTNEHKHYNGTTLVASAAQDNTPRIPMSMKGAANGVAELDAQGLVPSTQLPSYVDDIIDVYVTNNEGTISLFKDSAKTQAVTGETGKIYVDVEATIDGSYRWSGTKFVAIGTKVSTADRAINDSDGRPINSTYVKITAGKDLMLDTDKARLDAMEDNATHNEAGLNTSVDSNGKINVATATASTLGVASFGEGLTVASGNVTLAAAQATVMGGVKVAAVATSNINNDNGQISIPNASATQSGVVKVAAVATSNINNDNGQISVSTATNTLKGVASFGEGLTVASGNVTLAAAQATVMGGVKVAAVATSNINNNNGQLSVDTATDTLKGVASFGEGLTIADGNVTLTAANGTDVIGGVKQGTNVSIDDGVISVATANGSTTLGLVKAGTNVTIANGVVSVATANGSSTLGLAKAGTNVSVTDGAISVATFAGTANGVVPAPATSNASQYLAANGTWVGTSTTTSDGLMSSTDKSNLDTLWADKYVEVTEAQIRAMFE